MNGLSQKQGLQLEVDSLLAVGDNTAKVDTTILRVVLIVFSVLIIISLWGFYSSIRPPKIISSITPRDLKMNFEDLSFKTADGLTLRGWYIPSAKRTQKTLILLHGYPADKGNILPALAFLHEDFNLLLFDFRYLGKSEGNYSTAGAKEVEDLLAAIQFLKSRGVKEVGLWGFSMGGAVALMAIEKAPEIRAVISESSYASLAAMAFELLRIPVLNYPIAYLVGFWARLFLGIDVRDASPADRIRNTTLPILLIHSSADAVIPFSHARLCSRPYQRIPALNFGSPKSLPRSAEQGKSWEMHERLLQNQSPLGAAELPKTRRSLYRRRPILSNISRVGGMGLRFVTIKEDGQKADV